MSETVSTSLAEFVAAHPPETPPWTHEYVARHEALISAGLDHPELLRGFADGGELPLGYGLGFDERVVEYPWLFAMGPGGRVLDAGSTLNHAHILDRLMPTLTELYVTTLGPENVAFPERGISYVFADLRELPFRSGLFDTVVSLSTLEHVGMDNTTYGVFEARSDDPDRELAMAVAELKRVAVSGARMLLSVPYGKQEDHGWFRQFGNEDVDALLATVAPAEARLSVFRYTATGWQLSDLEQAGDAEYCDHTLNPESPQDLAAAARAVCCIDLRL